jgi:hypothetical protein
MLTPIQKEFAKNGLKFAHPNVTVYLSPDPVPAKTDPPEAIGATTPEVIEENNCPAADILVLVKNDECHYIRKTGLTSRYCGLI